jgi:hypothetical protein
MIDLRNKIARLHWSVLSHELAALRGDVGGLATRFSNEYGVSNEAAQRAEQVAAAIQRLEWALARQHMRSLSAASGG